MNPRLADKLASLPKRPGVYQHKDGEGSVLYVGKAKNLRNRVRSYFQDARPRDARLSIMINKIDDVEIIVTDTEVEALILENNLIKKLKPRYNINLRDDKSFPFICVKNEPFPRVFPTRKVVRDGSVYFGPYADVKRMKLMLRTIGELFKIRTCSLPLSEKRIAQGRFEVCLEYHIKRCLGPCVGYQSSDDYEERIRQVKQLLNGKTKALVNDLEDQMSKAADEKRYEDAAGLRDRIEALRKYASQQKIVSADLADRDVCAVATSADNKLAVGVMFNVREGKVIGSRHKHLTRVSGLGPGSVLQAFLEDHYTEAMFFPDEVLVSTELQDRQPLEAFLSDRKGRKVEIRQPQRGDKARLMRMVQTNATLLLDEVLLQKAKQEQDRIPHALVSLKKDLHLPTLPVLIECIDISHLGGTGTVASCVVFENGKPKKAAYRLYNIKTVVDKPDDFQSMREVVSRRYTHAGTDEQPLPDLLVIDGGKGQLSSVVNALKAAGVYGKIPVVGLAKRLEEVFFPEDHEAILIPKTSASLRLLQRARDEAHRFAITSQRKKRTKAIKYSSLRNIPGVGEKSVQKLIKAFGSVKRVRNASEEELAGVVGPALAKKIRATHT